MPSRKMRRGSVLIMVLWVISVLAIIVLSFAFEARQQAGIDSYVRERSRVRRLVDSGRMLGEAVILNYDSVKTPELKGGEYDWDEAFEKDRWVVEKFELKTTDKCVIGPIMLEDPKPKKDKDDDDETDPGTITIEISAENAKPGVDINCFTDDSDKNWVSRFQMILSQCGVPDDLEVEVEDADRGGKSTHNLMNLLLASWKDWRDEDDTISSGPLDDEDHDSEGDDGAEKTWYEERYEEDEIFEEDQRFPPNGPIKKLEELSYIRGFRDFPAILTGGLLYPNEKASEENPMLTGIMGRFKTSGGMKLQLNDETRREDLSTIPGIIPEDPDDIDAQEEGEELIEAILQAIRTMPEDDEDIDQTRTWWPFKDYADLCKRLEDCGYDDEVPSEVREYLAFPGDNSANSTTTDTTSKTTKSADGKKSTTAASDGQKVYKMTITGDSFGMKYVVSARCYVNDKSVMYIEWREDVPVEGEKKEEDGGNVHVFSNVK